MSVAERITGLSVIELCNYSFPRITRSDQVRPTRAFQSTGDSRLDRMRVIGNGDLEVMREREHLLEPLSNFLRE